MTTRSGPYLTTTTPSPTAIKYTFSSREHAPRRALLYLSHATRTILALCSLLIVLYKIQQTLYGDVSALVTNIAQTLLFTNLIDTIAAWPWYTVLSLCVLVFFGSVRRTAMEESLLVLRSLGIQTSSSSPFWMMGPTTRFIPSTQIQDIVVHEAFKGFEVKFYLAVIVKDAPEVVVVFPKLLPRRADLEVVWRGARKCLHETGGGGRDGSMGEEKM